MDTTDRGNIYAHPAITSSPELVWALQDRLGLRAVVEGRRVRLLGTPHCSGRTAPARIEQRGKQLFVVGAPQ